MYDDDDDALMILMTKIMKGSLKQNMSGITYTLKQIQTNIFSFLDPQESVISSNRPHVHLYQKKFE